ncbi:terminase family protein [Paenibacillus macerans]|uniref:terminase large subunit domain-containing protein n=1 Tax=Paenibacillus macerans TaxID=44252 RepID=UPI002DBFB6E4|nr:terminase family protein [Paenibacillus macerans]MEC0139723.1 terminase family protein [Paenibacillus macerans]
MSNTIVIPYKPQPRQQLYHQTNDIDELLYGGAAGGGKSEATIWDALKYAMQYPGSRQIIFRRTFPDLQRSIIARTIVAYPKELGKYNQSKHEWTFVNGSVIELAYFDSDSHKANYAGAEYDVIRWEELTHFEEGWYTFMLSRLRGSTPYPRYVKSTTNPGSVGHAWVKKRFIDIGAWEQVHKVQETDDNGAPLYHPDTGEPIISRRIFIPAKVQDNPKLLEVDPNYIVRLMQLPEQERKQLLDGDWDTFAGQYFSEFSRSLHVVEPFEIPREWKRYRVLDEGYTDPFVCLWIALAPDGTGYLYRELVQTKLLTSEQVELVRLNSPVSERYEYNVADTSFWNKAKTENITPAEIFAQKSVPLIQAKKERVNGWKRLREWLHPYDAIDHVTGKTYRTAKLKIFSTCIKAIEAIPAMVHDDKHVEDVAAHPLDHIPDALRYWVMSQPTPGRGEGAWSANPESLPDRRADFDIDDDDDQPIIRGFW